MLSLVITNLVFFEYLLNYVSLMYDFVQYVSVFIYFDYYNSGSQVKVQVGNGQEKKSPLQKLRWKKIDN